MDWAELTLRVVRGTGAIAGAAAGVVALMTEGAFARRPTPLGGAYEGTPLNNYRITPWGGILLAVILTAPAVQFVGDWIKDHNDSRTLTETTEAIKKDIDATVAAKAEQSRREIVSVVEIESRRQAEASAQASSQLSAMAVAANRTLREAERILQPLSDVRASFWFGIPLSDPELANFKDRFEAGIRPILARWQSSHVAGPLVDSGVLANVRDAAGKVESVEVDPGSPLYPDRGSETFAYTAFHLLDVHLYFYRVPIDVSEFPHFGSGFLGKAAPDIEMDFFAADDSKARLTLDYSPNDRTFTDRGFNVASDPKYWRSSGKILSLVDLAGAQVFITAEHLLVSFAEQGKRLHPTFRTLSLNIGSHESLWFRRERLTAHQDEASGGTVYEYRFPKTLEDIQAALK